MKNVIRRRWQRWLAKRLPPKRQQQLSHHSIFILPTPAGIAYLVLCVLLFVLGTNYQNNLILALTFLLISVFHTSLLMAFRNLSGLTISAGVTLPCHQGQSASFGVKLSAERPRYHLQLRFSSGDRHTIDVDGEHDTQCELNLTAPKRGLFNPGRVWIETRYPLGLCRAWSIQDLALSAIVWPKPIAGHARGSTEPSKSQTQTEQFKSGLDDFHGLVQWQPGESKSKVAWKQVAQTGSWQSKQFIEPLAPPTHLTLPPINDKELALSIVTDAVLKLEAKQHPYGLQLGNQLFDSDLGPHHLKRCLDALALYQEAVCTD